MDASINRYLGEPDGGVGCVCLCLYIDASINRYLGEPDCGVGCVCLCLHIDASINRYLGEPDGGVCARRCEGAQTQPEVPLGHVHLSLL